MVEMDVGDDGVLDDELFGNRQRTGHSSCVDEDAIVDEKCRRLLADPGAAERPEHPELHVARDSSIIRARAGRPGAPQACRPRGSVLEHAHGLRRSPADRMSAKDFDYPTMARALILGDKDTVARKTQEGLGLSMDPKDLIFKRLIPGMDVVGEKFRRNEYYVPQVLLSARAMYAGLDLLKPRITAAARPGDNLGVVVIGTAQAICTTSARTWWR